MSKMKVAARLAIAVSPAPQPNILNPEFKYTSSVDTDITKTWAKYGWTPKEKRHGAHD